MKLTLGFSPCPNDTFIFDALVNHKINTGPFDFDVVLEDVQTLNQWAIEERLDITKISYGVLPLVINGHYLLESGGALGKGAGPLLIAKKHMDLDEVNGATIAIPGMHTTAHLLFSLGFPKALKKEFMLFSAIEGAVWDGQVDAGVIIHENRFTYQDRGLIKLVDLGTFWEEKTGCPIPLGGIVMKRKFNKEIAGQINDYIRKSIEYAFSGYPEISFFVQQHAQEMSQQVMRQHIELYVNQYSLSLGQDGRKAIETLLSVYAGLHHSTDQLRPSVIG